MGPNTNSGTPGICSRRLVSYEDRRLTSTLNGEIRAILGGGAEEDRIAVAHFVVGALFLILGSLLEVLAFIFLRFPEGTSS